MPPTERLRRYRFFPQSYAEGRDWFRSLAADAGGTLHTHTNPAGLTPAGAPLTTDIAWFGTADAPRVMVTISGTHGQEYFSGAAAQLSWIACGGPAALPRDVAVCLVHANNPYGAAWASRGNEDFVDLNRNYMDHAVTLRPNSLYAELFEILFTPDLDDHILDDVMAAFYAFVARHDPVAAMTAMGGGQRSHPTGTLFCGFAPAWSTRNLQSLASTLLDRVERVAVIDWHTGLGDFGEATVMNAFAEGGPEADWGRHWWSIAPPNAELAGSAKPDYVGIVCEGLAANIKARGALAAPTVVEFGTFGNEGVLHGILIDRWLRFACPDPLAPDAITLRTRMLERLNPSNPEWRDAVLGEAARLHDRTIEGLAAWR